MQKSGVSKSIKFLTAKDENSQELLLKQVIDRPIKNSGFERPKAIPLHNRALDNVMHAANVNPFTPDSE